MSNDPSKSGIDAMNSRDILEKLIAYDTISANPNMELMQFISGLLSQYGIHSKLLPNDQGTKANLYATLGPAETGGVMLSGHTDVVPVEGQDWTKPPFELTQEADRFYGRGTADMKGFVASAIVAALKASRLELKTPLHLAFSYDEEIGCVGVHSMIEMLARAPSRPAMCIVGEPTNLSVATGHKGKVGMIAKCHGLEGHSALAPYAFNALHLACDFVGGVRKIQNELERHGQRDADFDVPYSTVHVGKINGGVALNIVPNFCEVVFEIRNIAHDDPEDILARIKEETRAIVAAATEQYQGADIEIEIFNTYPGMNTAANDDVVKFVQSLTGANDLCKVAFGTEGGLFSRKLGIPTVICGPGSMEQGHKPDEYIEVEQLDRCDAMLDRLLDRLQAGI